MVDALWVVLEVELHGTDNALQGADVGVVACIEYTVGSRVLATVCVWFSLVVGVGIERVVGVL